MNLNLKGRYPFNGEQNASSSNLATSSGRTDWLGKQYTAKEGNYNLSTVGTGWLDI